MYGKSSEKLTALTFSCTDSAVTFLSGKGGILETHKLFGGMNKSVFLRLAFVLALKNPPTKTQFLEALKYSTNAVTFDSFCKQFKGGKN